MVWEVDGTKKLELPHCIALNVSGCPVVKCRNIISTIRNNSIGHNTQIDNSEPYRYLNKNATIWAPTTNTQKRGKKRYSTQMYSVGRISLNIGTKHEAK
jgi:hypothetical protein